MNITVFGATGQVGKRIVNLALGKGYYVTAFGRNVESLLDKDARDERLAAFKGYVFSETDVFDAVKNADAVISVLGGGMDVTDKTRSLGIKNIIKQMEKAGVKRIVALGGMGVLDDSHGHYLLDSPTYPEEYRIVGQEHLHAYEFLRDSTLDWSFVCAPDIHDNDASGHYVTAADHVPDPNNYAINAGDLASFMLKEVSDNKYLKKRVGISLA